MKPFVRTHFMRPKASPSLMDAAVLQPLSTQFTATDRVQEASYHPSQTVISFSPKAVANVVHALHADVQVNENLATGQTILSGNPNEVARVMAQIDHHENTHAAAAPSDKEPQVPQHEQPQAHLFLTPIPPTDEHPSSYGAGASWFAQAFVSGETEVASNVTDIYTANYFFHASHETFSFLGTENLPGPTVQHRLSSDILPDAASAALPQQHTAPTSVILTLAPAAPHLCRSWRSL